jgi:hypothetical protein
MNWLLIKTSRCGFGRNGFKPAAVNLFKPGLQGAAKWPCFWEVLFSKIYKWICTCSGIVVQFHSATVFCALVPTLSALVRWVSEMVRWVSEMARWVSEMAREMLDVLWEWL